MNMEKEMGTTWREVRLKNLSRKLFPEATDEEHHRRNPFSYYYQPFFSSKLKEKLKSTYEKWKAADRPGGTFNILDIGAGKGNALRQMIGELGLQKDVQLLHHNLLAGDFRGEKTGNRVIANAAALPFAENSVHFVTGTWAIPYVNNKIEALREVDFVLHPKFGWAALHLTDTRVDMPKGAVKNPESGKEVVKTGKKTIPLPDWLKKHEIKIESPESAEYFSVSFNKGINLPKAKVRKSSEMLLGTGKPQPVFSTYEVVE